MAKVCVCIPTRNRVEYVKETIQSVLDQTFVDFRVLVSDDASEVEAAQKVKAWIHHLNDSRIAYHYHNHNLREFGHGRFLFAQCVEELFTILHDDDIWDPLFLERTVNILSEDESLACVFSNQRLIDAAGNIELKMTSRYWRAQGRERYQEGRLKILEPCLYYGFFHLCGAVFRTSALKESSFVDPEYEGNSGFDVNVFLRLGENNGTAYYIPRPLVGIRVHRGSLTNTWDSGFTREILERYMSMFEKRVFKGKPEQYRKRCLSALYHNYAIVCYFKGDIGGMYRYIGKCVRASPWRWRNWAYAILVVLLRFVIEPVFKSRVRV